MTTNPIFWLLAAGVLAVAVVLASGLRADRDRRRALALAGLRIGAAMVFALVLLQPQCHRREVTVERPVIGVLVDTSQSMQDEGRGRAALDWLESPAFRTARETCELKVFSLAEGVNEVVPGQITFNGKTSAIHSGLAEWSRRHGKGTAAGIVLISDGLDTGGGPPPTLDIPCWAMEVEPPRDVPARVTVWQVEPPSRPRAGVETSVRVVVQAWGTADKDIPVELWSDGSKLGEKRVRFGKAGEVAEAILAIKPERPGTHAYEIRVADPAADASARAQPFVLNVRQAGEGIILLANSLGFEGKFLRRALTTNRNIQLASFARWQDGRWASIAEDAKAAATDTLDISAAGLASRVAVVLADVSPDALTPPQWQAIRDFTSNGGGLVVLGGPNLLASPHAAAVLGNLLPVPTPAPHRDGRFGVKLTDAGLRHPVFGPLFESVREFPALQGANLTAGVAGNAQVLMETVADGQAHPLVVVKQQGKGRVAVVLSDTLWRWRVAAPGWTGRLSAYDTFWSQLLDWLAPRPDNPRGAGTFDVSTGRPYHHQGDTVGIQAEWLGRGDPPGDALTATVTDPAGTTTVLQLAPASWQSADGRRVLGFRAEIAAATAGVHDVVVRSSAQDGEAASTRFAVVASIAERRGEPADTSALGEIARRSGGAYVTRADAAKWPARLPKPERQSEREVITDAWNHPVPAIVLLACLCGEWWIRRHRGLA